MREEYNSVLSTPTEADKIGRYRYIGKTQISADISFDLYIETPPTRLTVVCAAQRREAKTEASSMDDDLRTGS